MKIISLAALLVPVLALESAFAEQEAGDGSEVLARRGDGVVTQAEFDARIARIPEEHRRMVLRDRVRLRELLNNLLLRSQLAAAAREAGLDEDPRVEGRMRLAAEEELGNAWLEHYTGTLNPADYETLAREFYVLNEDQFVTQPTIDVTHILIGTEDRTEDEALEIAIGLRDRIVEDPAQFDALVMEYSDDPSAASNEGRFTGVSRGQMVKPFEEAAFALQPGEISEPVKTVYGYHIIRLDALNPSVKQSFEDVRGTLVERQRRRHVERLRNEYLSYLTSIEVEMTPEALEQMVERHFGKETDGEAGGQSE